MKVKNSIEKSKIKEMLEKGKSQKSQNGSQEN